jgi:hypothetical protein
MRAAKVSRHLSLVSPMEGELLIQMDICTNAPMTALVPSIATEKPNSSKVARSLGKKCAVSA